MAADYKEKIGLQGTLLIEPKPQEPTKHQACHSFQTFSHFCELSDLFDQYDFDAATTIGFLKNYGLDKDFKLVVECNHATLAGRIVIYHHTDIIFMSSGHSCEHELIFASQYGMLGSIDLNTGDPQTVRGWQE